MLIFDVKWDAKTAGPSPDGTRTELFLFGCKKAAEGNPCKGCFNSATWDSSKATKSHTPREVADNINKYAPNKYVTIGGGEPTDQMEELIELCKYLKEYGFHIMVYTWRELKTYFREIGPYDNTVNAMFFLERKQFKDLLNYIDMFVDGQFILEECMYKEEAEDGTFNSIGSGNQIIWDVKKFNEDIGNIIEGYMLKDVQYIYLNKYNNLRYSHIKDTNLLEIAQEVQINN